MADEPDIPEGGGGLSAGAVFGTLGVEIDDRGFLRFDKEMARVDRSEAVAALGVKVEERGFREFDRQMAAVEKSKATGTAAVDVDRRSVSQVRGLRNEIDGLDSSVVKLNRNSQGLRNLGGLLKFPAIIAGAGAAAQALSAMAGGAAALLGSLSALSGGLVAVPAGIGVLLQALGAGALGLSGVSDAVGALNEVQARGGQAAIDYAAKQSTAAEQVRSAENAVEDAERSVKAATEGLTDARRQATQQLVDMRLAADQARLGEEGAELALRSARNRLRDLPADASGLDRRQALYDIEVAELGVKDARIQSRRSSDELNEAEKRGIRNSEPMVAAREALSEADRAAAEASHQLAVTTRETNATLAEGTATTQKLQQQMDSMPKSAQRFSKFIYGLKGDLDALRETAADGLLPGVEKGMRSALRNLPIIDRVVGRTSGVLGDLAKRAGDLFGSRGFGRDFEKIGDSNADSLERMGKGGIFLTSALRHVLVAARPLLRTMSGGIRDFGKFADEEARAGRESGALAKFFEETEQTGGRVLSILKRFGGAIWEIIRLGDPLGDSILKKLDQSAKRFQDWTESAGGRNEIAAYFRDIEGPLDQAGGLLGDIVKAFFRLGRQPGLEDLLSKIRTGLLPALEEMIGSVTQAFGPPLVDFIVEAMKLFTTLASESGPLAAFVSLLAQITGFINDLLEFVPGLGKLVASFATMAATVKAIQFAGAITGVSRLTAHYRGLEVAATRASAAQAASARMPIGRGVIPGTAGGGIMGGIGQRVGAARTAGSTYGLARSFGYGRLASTGAQAGAFGMGAAGLAKGGLSAVGRFLGPVGLGLTGLLGANSFMKTEGGIGRKLQGAASTLSFGLINAPKSKDALYQEGLASGDEQVATGMKLKDLNARILEIKEEIGAADEFETAQLQGQLAPLEEAARLQEKIADARSRAKAEELFGGKGGLISLFEQVKKESGSASEAFAVSTDEMLQRVGRLRDEGSARLAEMYLRWAKTQAKRHPELRGEFDQLSDRIQTRWDRAGKEIIITNGRVTRNTKRDWRDMERDLHKPIEEHLQTEKDRLTDTQKAFRDALVAFGGYTRSLANFRTWLETGDAVGLGKGGIEGWSKRNPNKVDAAHEALTPLKQQLRDISNPPRNQFQAGRRADRRDGDPRIDFGGLDNPFKRRGGQEGGLVTGGGILGPLNRVLGRVLGFQAGGIVPGFSPPGPMDTVPAMLQPGELVVPKADVDRMRKRMRPPIDEEIEKENRERGKRIEKDTEAAYKGAGDGARRQQERQRDTANRLGKETEEEHENSLMRMAKATERGYGGMAETIARRGRDWVDSTRRTMSESDSALFQGMNYLSSAVAKGLKSFDAKPASFDVPKPKGYAGGGILGGFGRRDTIPLLMGMAAPGEAVLTHQQQDEANEGLALKKMLGLGRFGSLGEMFSGLRTPHYFARGGYVQGAPQVPRFQSGGAIEPPGDPGSEVVQAAYAGAVSSFLRKWGMDLTQGYNPGGPSVSAGHLSLSAPPSLDVVPLNGDWGGMFLAGLKWAISQGWTVGYGSRGVGEAWPNHGEGNHAHIDWGGGANAQMIKGALGSAAGVKKLRKLMVEGTPGPLRDLIQEALGSVHGAANRSLSKSSGSIDVATGPVQAMARKMVGGIWGMSQWDPFVKLEMSEAGWNPRAVNPSSGAAGLAQALPASKYPPGAWPYRGPESAKIQLQWMMSYIKERYGTPASAWAFHMANNWYARGGKLGGLLTGKGTLSPGKSRQWALEKFRRATGLAPSSKRVDRLGNLTDLLKGRTKRRLRPLEADLAQMRSKRSSAREALSGAREALAKGQKRNLSAGEVRDLEKAVERAQGEWAKAPRRGEIRSRRERVANLTARRIDPIQHRLRGLTRALGGEYDTAYDRLDLGAQAGTGAGVLENAMKALRPRRGLPAGMQSVIQGRRAQVRRTFDVGSAQRSILANPAFAGGGFLGAVASQGQTVPIVQAPAQPQVVAVPTGGGAGTPEVTLVLEGSLASHDVRVRQIVDGKLREVGRNVKRSQAFPGTSGGRARFG